MIVKKENEKKFIEIKDIVRISGLRYSTIKYWIEMGLVQFEQPEPGLRRKFNKDETLKRLDEIKSLREKRFTIAEIIEKLKSKKS